MRNDMKESLQEKLVEWIQNFTLNEVPLFIQQAARFEFWSSLIWGIICAVLLIGTSIFCYQCYKEKGEEKNREYNLLMPMFISAGISFFLFIAMCCNLNDMMKATMAPGLYVIEKLLNK